MQEFHDAFALTREGLLQVLGLHSNADTEEIKNELYQMVGRTYDEEGRVYQAQWWNGTEPQGVQREFKYRILPKLEPPVRNELGTEDREIKYLYTRLGMVGLNVMAFEGVVIAAQGDAVTTPAYLLNDFVRLIKAYLTDEQWVDAPLGRPSAKFSLVSAGVGDEPLYRPALIEAGLTEKEIERLSEFYQLYDPFKREPETHAALLLAQERIRWFNELTESMRHAAESERVEEFQRSAQLVCTYLDSDTGLRIEERKGFSESREER